MFTEQPPSDEIEKLFPERMPVKVQQALQNRKVDFNTKGVIVKSVVDRLFEKRMDSNRCLEKAARRVLKKYTPLKSKLDPNGVSISCIDCLI